jgi:hypothetical protein
MKKNRQGEGGGTLSKIAIYQKAAAHALDAIEVLAREMKEGDNSGARVGAAKALLAKCLPDLKSTDFTPETRQMFISILGGNSSVSSHDSDTQIAGPEKEN